MIQLSNISFYIRKTNILSGINIDINKGSFVCVLGENGAGKSSLARIIAGLNREYTGEVLIKSKNLRDYKTRELAGVISYVPQGGDFLSGFSVEDYIMTGRYHQQKIFGETKQDLEIVEYVMTTVGVEKLRKRDLSTLSGGERQRVIIGAALAQQADIIILDEPSVYLDPKSSAELNLLLRRINGKGITVFLVTHDVNQALSLGNRFIGVKDGKIWFDSCDINEMISKNYIDSLFDIKFTTLKTEQGIIMIPINKEINDA